MGKFAGQKVILSPSDSVTTHTYETQAISPFGSKINAVTKINRRTKAQSPEKTRERR